MTRLAPLTGNVVSCRPLCLLLVLLACLSCQVHQRSYHKDLHHGGTGIYMQQRTFARLQQSDMGWNSKLTHTVAVCHRLTSVNMTADGGLKQVCMSELHTVLPVQQCAVAGLQQTSTDWY